MPVENLQRMTGGERGECSVVDEGSMPLVLMFEPKRDVAHVYDVVSADEPGQCHREPDARSAPIGRNKHDTACFQRLLQSVACSFGGEVSA